MSFFLKLLVIYYKIPGFIIHSHATRYSDRLPYSIRNHVFCSTIRFMNCERLACSKEAGRFLFGDGAADRGNVQLLYNAVDIPHFRFHSERRRTSRNKLGFSDGDIVLGHIGRFTRQKNHQFLMNIFHVFLNYEPNAKLLCIGDGRLREQTEQKARRLGIWEHIRFLGLRSDVADLLDAMDIFLLPSLFEGYPVSFVEACCNGLPCVVSDTFSSEWDCGHVCRISLKRSPEEWAQKVLEGIRKGRWAGMESQLFDINQQAKKLEVVYLK